MFGIRQTACMYFNEDEMSELLYHLPKKNKLRDKLQEAGQNIFRWKKWK